MKYVLRHVHEKKKILFIILILYSINVPTCKWVWSGHMELVRISQVIFLFAGDQKEHDEK